MNIKFSDVDGASLFRRSSWIWPTLLNNDSEGTLVAGIESKIFAIAVNVGKFFPWVLYKLKMSSLSRLSLSKLTGVCL